MGSGQELEVPRQARTYARCLQDFGEAGEVVNAGIEDGDAGGEELVGRL